MRRISVTISRLRDAERPGDVTWNTKQVKLELRPEVSPLPFWAQLFLYQVQELYERNPHVLREPSRPAAGVPEAARPTPSIPGCPSLLLKRPLRVEVGARHQ
jgi:hypothetical protein